MLLALASVGRSRSSAIAGSPRSQRPTRAGFVARPPGRRAGLDRRHRHRPGRSSLVLGTNGWVETPDGWVSGGWNWSDLLVHVSIGSSIAAGNFPPEVPYFAGVPLTYHWFADFHGAITSTVAGVDLIGVYFATSALFAGVLGARRLGARDAASPAPSASPRSRRSSSAPAAAWAGSGSSAT